VAEWIDLLTSTAEVQGLGTGRRGARVSNTLADKLASLIAAGELGEGQRLPSERELMALYGVSRAGVREAIAILANRGLLLTRPGYRPLVGRPDYDRTIAMIGDVVGHLLTDEAGIRNLYDTRIFLECALARSAAERAEKEDIEDLRATLERNRAAIGRKGEFYATDMAFHAVLYRVPRNPIYPVIHKAYNEWLLRHWYEMRSSEEIDRINFASHATLFDAIVARDGTGAERAMRRHLEVAWEQVRATFHIGSPRLGQPERGT
jgi:DNA-binding FadR family transcriptional regulator